MCSSEFQALGGREVGREFVAWNQGDAPSAFSSLQEATPVKPLALDLQERAEKLLEEARQRAVHLEREAFQKGFAQGERAGRQMAERAMEDTLRALGIALEQWEEHTRLRNQQVVQEVVRLALAVARKILQREVHQDPGVILDVVKSGLSRAGVRENVIVRVHPLDAETISEARADLLQELQELRSLRIEADESVGRGGALVQCPMGELDLRLERQFREIELAFERLLAEDSSRESRPLDSQGGLEEK